jgi:hypothetical protein
MSRPTLSLFDAISALRALPDDRREAAMRAILAETPDGTFQSAIDADDRLNPARRPPMVELLDQARDYAERLVLQDGIEPELAADMRTAGCCDGYLGVAGQWCEHLVPEAYAFFGDMDAHTEPAFEAAYQMRDAGYLLGVAVGLQLRGGAR